MTKLEILDAAQNIAWADANRAYSQWCQSSALWNEYRQKSALARKATKARDDELKKVGE